MNLLSIGIAIVALLVGFFGGKIAFEKILKQNKEDANKEIEKTKKEAKDVLQKAEYQASKIEERAEKEIKHKELKLEKTEERLEQKEQRMEEKMEKLEAKKEEYQEKKRALEKVLEKEKTILSDLSWLSPEEAKKQLFEQIEQDQQKEISRFVNKFKMIKEEESKEEAGKIIAKVLPRVAQEWMSEHLVTMVDLPSEDMKGKIIGREGRNIGAFERVTGVEVNIDDTPMTLKLSCYDPEKRYMAQKTMEKIIKEGRINPVYIERMHEETLKEAGDIFLKKGKEALSLLNIPMMKPEIVEYIGRFHIRYSYGQNLLLHSIEVARMAEMLANEMGLNADLAKKAWLLHDIGKIDAGNGEAHTKIGAEILKKYKMNDCIVNTAEGHHFDVELKYPEAWIATAADIISASRPWARNDTKDLFIERMGNLENLITSIDGVQKSYIMQAGREIMAFFNPDTIDDATMEKLTVEIGTKIEDQLDYPGSIRVVGIREKKMVHFLR